MYKILGVDQKQYGPVSAETLRQWLAERRVTAQTLVLAEGGAEWKPLSSFPELGIGAGPVAAPAPVYPSGVSAGTTVQSALGVAKTSAMAITSLVLGLLGFFTCGMTGIFGLIFGIISTVKIGKSQGQLTGKGMAIAGICVSAVTLLIVPVWITMMLPALSQAKQKAQSIQCITNLKQLGLAARMYAADNNDKLPKADAWSDTLQSYLSNTNLLLCPAERSRGRCNYAFNAKLSGLKVNQVNPKTVLFFECPGGWNTSGGPELMLQQSRHKPFINIIYADGSVERLLPSKLRTLRWDP